MDFPNIGNLDFVATSIALNVATEFWKPLSERLKLHLTKNIDYIRQKNAEAIVNRLDEDVQDNVKSSTDRAFEKLLTKAKTCKSWIINNYVYLAVFAATAGIIILYLGISNKWNVLLFSPVPILLIVSKLSGFWFQGKAWNINRKVKKAVSNHANGGKEIDRTFTIDV